jgi:hypothetical protein
MNKLIQRVQDISDLDLNLREHEMKMNMMDKCVDYFKAAVQSSSTHHELFSLLDR